MGVGVGKRWWIVGGLRMPVGGGRSYYMLEGFL